MMLLILTAGLACATTGSLSSSTNDEAAIRALEEQERLAVLNKNFTALEGIWSERFMVNAPTNQIAPNRNFVLAAFRQGLAYSSFERNIERVFMEGDLAIVMGGETIKPTGNAPMAGQTVPRRFTHIWKKEGGAWRLLARHANVIAASVR
jgi:ketosteroid isomerase-like protein